MKRIITAIVMIAVFVPVIFLSHTLLFPIAVALMGAVASWEILSIRGLHKKLYILIPTLLFVVSCPLVSGTEWFDIFTSRSYNFLVVAFPTYMIYLLFIAVACNRKISFNDIAYTSLSVSYLALSMFAIPFVRERAQYDFLLLIVCPCATDIFALYGGTLFGKKKLCPAVSQHKTVEGFISGILGGIVGAFLCGVIKHFAFGSDIEVLFLLVAGIGISIVGQYGDLVASLMKRNCGVKDFGSIFPGHGGVMDRFDSIFASFACAFVFLTAYNKIFMLI